jgi:hypothetical protein
MPYTSVAGTLEGCVEVAPKKAATDRCTSANADWEQDCLDVLDDYGPDRTSACPDLGDASTVGSSLGNALEAAWAAQDRRSNLTQVDVPYANKDDCEAGAAVGQRGVGRPDLLQVVLQDADGIRVRVGDVKPLTRSGLDLGWSEIQDCYLPAIERAGAACGRPAAQRTAEEDAFCRKVGVGDAPTKVLLDDEPGVSWSGTPLDGVDVHTCSEGVVAYTCP